MYRLNIKMFPRVKIPPWGQNTILYSSTQIICVPTKNYYDSGLGVDPRFMRALFKLEFVYTVLKVQDELTPNIITGFTRQMTDTFWGV